MKFVVLVNRDLASTVALNHLLPKIANHDISILMSDRVGKKSALKPQALNELAVVEQGILNDLMHDCSNSEWQTIPALAKRYDCTVAVENWINRERGIETLSRLAPDLIISIRYGVILKSSVIKIPALGVINLHSGLLPDYRGVMATFWAMLKDENSIGMTLHYIDDSSIDTGRIIGSTRLQIDSTKSYLDHVLQLYENGCELIVAMIDMLEKGEEPVTTKQEGGGEYFTFPEAEDLDLFTEKGLRLFDLESVLATYKRFIAR
jgi:methionyl-tRNA formyltransferase